MRARIGWGIAGGSAAMALALGAVAFAQAPQRAGQAPHPGRAVYERACAMCHDNAEATKSPPLTALQTMSPDAVHQSLVVGKMREQGSMLQAQELAAVVDYLAGANRTSDDWTERAACPAERRAVDLSGPETLTRFGVDYQGSRRMSAAQAGLTSDDLGKLEVAWTLGLPQTNALRSAPVIVGSTLFYSASQAGYVLALDTRTGCVKWSFKAPRPMRTSMTYGPLGPGGPKALIVGDVAGQVMAIEAESGKLLWSVEGRHDPEAVLTGAPVLWRDRIIVPVSALDVARAGNPAFPCCKVHGAVVALNARDGARLWAAHTMEEARPTGEKNSAGTDLWGPSGAAVWSSPTLDERRGVVYVGTGQNTSHPATGSSNAIWAIDVKTGRTKWFFQGLANDVWNMACSRGANCPSADRSVLKDFDFGSQAIVARDARGRELLLAGQKSGDVWAIDSRGREVWRRKLSPGSPLGGVHWGVASDGKRLFAPIADPAGAGMYALDVATGEVIWSRQLGEEACRSLGGPDGPRRGAPGFDAALFARCRGAGISALPLVIDGAVVAGTLDGKLMAFDAADGRVIATLDTAQSFETVNGVAGKGGSIDSHSIFAGDGHLYVGSGYAQFGAPAGNVLIAYRPKR